MCFARHYELLPSVVESQSSELAIAPLSFRKMLRKKIFPIRIGSKTGQRKEDVVGFMELILIAIAIAPNFAILVDASFTEMKPQADTMNSVSKESAAINFPRWALNQSEF